MQCYSTQKRLFEVVETLQYNVSTNNDLRQQ